ncbi:MAG: ribonuclease HI [Candidatus Omnitrophica bacterium]|nr:ribonuclease HI [Candidatus Omnitrophota bacterium]MDX9754708.1 ribonuclease HI [bacterium]
MKKTDFEVMLYTDGGCSGNPGPGGWAFVLQHIPTGKEMEQNGAEKLTTNNKMEMTAVIEGLKQLKRRTRVCVVTDSNYIKQGITTWIINWKKNNWMRKEGTKFVPVKNVDLWKAMDALVAQHDVTFEWVRGHAGHPENERCDELAVSAYQKYL